MPRQSKLDLSKIKPEALREPVRPEGLLLAIQRELRKKHGPDSWPEELRQSMEEGLEAYRNPEPIIVPNPIDPREGLARVAVDVVSWYEHTQDKGLVDELASWLERAGDQIVAEGWRKGKPLNHEDVKRALTNLYITGLQIQGKTPPIIVSDMNRADRRALARKTNRKVVNV
jgi:hypothetical protein